KLKRRVCGPPPRPRGRRDVDEDGRQFKETEYPAALSRVDASTVDRNRNTVTRRQDHLKLSLDDSEESFVFLSGGLPVSGRLRTYGNSVLYLDM
ncbi:hypothetical protein GWI33_006238, partial [Rhynchophorus ferrugineus]